MADPGSGAGALGVLPRLCRHGDGLALGVHEVCDERVGGEVDTGHLGLRVKPTGLVQLGQDPGHDILDARPDALFLQQ